MPSAFTKMHSRRWDGPGVSINVYNNSQPFIYNRPVAKTLQMIWSIGGISNAEIKTVIVTDSLTHTCLVDKCVSVCLCMDAWSNCLPFVSLHLKMICIPGYIINVKCEGEVYSFKMFVTHFLCTRKGKDTSFISVIFATLLLSLSKPFIHWRVNKVYWTQQPI